jgi:hypothetical protein
MLALSCPALAGIMHTPAPAPPDTQAGQTAQGEMPNGLTETLLSVLDSVLALL